MAPGECLRHTYNYVFYCYLPDYFVYFPDFRKSAQPCLPFPPAAPGYPLPAEDEPDEEEWGVGLRILPARPRRACFAHKPGAMLYNRS
jgi:hypothetical protein